MFDFGSLLLVTGIILPALLLRYGVLSAVRYSRLSVRNRDLAQLAQEYQCTFVAHLPNYFQFCLAYFSGVRVNTMTGMIGKHTIQIEDYIKFRLVWRRSLYTVVTVDDQVVPGGLSQLTLGSTIFLTSLAELRTLLQSLRSA